MRKDNFYKSLYARLLFLFLIIITPVYLVGMLMNYWGSRVVKEEVYDSMVTQVNYYLSDLENEIQSLKMLQYDCLYDENLNRLAILWKIMEQYDRQQRMLQLQKRLITIRDSSSFVSDVTAHIIPIDKTISASNSIIPLEKDQVMINPDRDETGQAVFIQSNGQIYMTTLIKNQIMGDNGLFAIDVVFDQKRLMEKLGKLNSNENSGILLMYHFNASEIVERNDTNMAIPVELIKEGIKDQNNNISLVDYNGEKYYVAYETSEYLGVTFVKYVPESVVMEPLETLYIWFWAFTALSLILFVLFSISIHKYLHEPLTNLVQAFKQVEKGEINVVIEHKSNDEFGYIYRRFNAMVERIHMLIDQIYRQKIMTQRAELKQLQSQINPHFLYNSFFLINMMARVQDDNLIPFTKKLGEYFRFVTKSGSDLISLTDEVRHAKVYTDIQMMRFSKRLELSFDPVPVEFETLTVPRLILQPIIENAFEHAIERQKEGKLIVTFEAYDNMLELIVEDSGDEIDSSKIRQLKNQIEDDTNEEVSGMINVHRRIQLLFGQDSGIYVGRSSIGGLKVILRIVEPGKAKGMLKTVSEEE